jgi:hypothetical protein
LNADNQRLAGLLAKADSSQASSDSQFRELLRLRGEVGRLKSKVRDMAMAKTATSQSHASQLETLKKMYAERVERLKQWLEDHPSEKIPELQSVNDDTWLGAVDQLNLESDDDFARAARILRANAEGQVLDALWGALRKYGSSNNGQFPTDLSQLIPYLKSPIGDLILQRYEIVPANSLVSELQPGGDWVITQAAPVNPALDIRNACSLTGMRNADERVSNRWSFVTTP